MLAFVATGLLVLAMTPYPGLAAPTDSPPNSNGYRGGKSNRGTPNRGKSDYSKPWLGAIGNVLCWQKEI